MAGGYVSATDMTERDACRLAGVKGVGDVNVIVLGAHGSST